MTNISPRLKRRRKDSWVPHVAISAVTAILAVLIINYKISNSQTAKALTPTVQSDLQPEQKKTNNAKVSVRRKETPNLQPQVNSPTYQYTQPPASNPPNSDITITSADEVQKKDFVDQQLEELEFAQEREWTIDGKKQKAFLQGVTADKGTVFLLSELGSTNAFKMDSLGEDDKLFCADMIAKHKQNVIMTVKIDLTIYESPGFKKVQLALERYAQKIVRLDSRDTSAQNVERYRKAFQAADSDLNGIEFRIPVVIEDVEIVDRVGKKCNISIHYQSLYRNLPVQKEIKLWVSSDDALKYDRGAVLWLSAEVASVKPRAIDRFQLQFQTIDFVERTASDRTELPEAFASFDIPVCIMGFRVVKEDESLELLNRYSN